ncbi:MAG: hypothetical protein AB7U82_18985 [Blastocatellales bacterium]
MPLSIRDHACRNASMRSWRLRSPTIRINTQLEKLRQVIATDVPASNKLVRDREVLAVWVKPQR